MSDEMILLINEQGEKIGNINRQQAQKIAEEKDLDLYCVNEEKKVYKLIDTEKKKYNRKKIKKQHIQKLKEVKFGMTIASHDKEVKLKQINKFLKKNNKIKITIEVPRRSPFGKDEINDFLKSILDSVNECFELESKSKFNGRNLNIIIKPD